MYAALRPKAIKCKDACDHVPNRGGKSCYELHERRSQIRNMSTREEVLAKTGGECYAQIDGECQVYLTTEPNHKNTLRVDHVYPFSSGGYDGMANWWPLCEHCNAVKKQRDGDEFCSSGAAGHCAIDAIGIGGHGVYRGRTREGSSFEDVIAMSSSVPTAVMFHSPTCHYCTIAGPDFDAAASAVSSVAFVRINTRTVATPRSITSVPTFWLMVDGRHREYASVGNLVKAITNLKV